MLLRDRHTPEGVRRRWSPLEAVKRRLSLMSFRYRLMLLAAAAVAAAVAISSVIVFFVVRSQLREH